MNRAFKTVVKVRNAIRQDFNRLVVFVAANIALFHFKVWSSEVSVSNPAAPQIADREDRPG